MKIQLTDRQLAKIMRPVKGKGGFQTLLRRIQKQVSGNILTASNEDVERLICVRAFRWAFGWVAEV